MPLEPIRRKKKKKKRGSDRFEELARSRSLRGFLGAREPFAFLRKCRGV